MYMSDVKEYDTTHGSPFDRGSADSYYHRPRDPHYWPAGTGHGEQVVELVQVAGGQHRVAVEQARVLGQLGQGLGLHALQEHAGVDLPVEAAADGPPAGGQVHR